MSPVEEPVPELLVPMTSMRVTRTESPVDEPEKLARTCEPSWMSVRAAFFPSFITSVLFETLSF